LYIILKWGFKIKYANNLNQIYYNQLKIFFWGYFHMSKDIWNAFHSILFPFFNICYKNTWNLIWPSSVMFKICTSHKLFRTFSHCIFFSFKLKRLAHVTSNYKYIWGQNDVIYFSQLTFSCNARSCHNKSIKSFVL